MSKALGQSQSRRQKRIAKGLQNDMPSSQKLTESGRNLTTTYRTKKYVVQLSKEEIERRERRKRKLEKKAA